MDADEQLLKYYQPAAECFRKAWENVSDDVLCRLVAAIDGGEFTRLAVRLISSFPPFHVLAAELSEEDQFSLLTDLTLALSLSVGAEFIGRVESADTKEGRITRKWAASGGDLTLGDAEALGRFAQRKLRYNPDDLGFEREENGSIILLACAQLLKEESIPTANSREGLAKLISGWFNRIPKRADNILREHIRKRQTNWKLTEQVDSKTSKDSEQDYRQQRTVKKAFREECHPEEDWILLAEIRATETLTPEERRVVDLGLNGFTQKEMAEKLAVSQPRINQLKASAIQKIKLAQSQR